MGRATPLDHSSLYEADERLHRKIVEASAGPRLLALHDSVKPQAERYIRMYISMLDERHPRIGRRARRDHRGDRGRQGGRSAGGGADELAPRRRPDREGDRGGGGAGELVTELP